MAEDKQAVLLSWVAVNNDPYERERGSGDFRRVDGKPIPGPTLTLLCDPASLYSAVIGDVVFFHTVKHGSCFLLNFSNAPSVPCAFFNRACVAPSWPASNSKK